MALTKIICADLGADEKRAVQQIGRCVESAGVWYEIQKVQRVQTPIAPTFVPYGRMVTADYAATNNAIHAAKVAREAAVRDLRRAWNPEQAQRHQATIAQAEATLAGYDAARVATIRPERA